MTLTSPSQAVYATRRNLAPVFGIPQHKLHVVSPLVGGGFGGKEDSTLDVCVVAGVLALKTGRTVFFELNREEIFRTTGKRHASYIRHRLAADATGRILGMDIRFVLDKGAYVSLGGMKEPFGIYESSVFLRFPWVWRPTGRLCDGVPDGRTGPSAGS